MFCRLFYELESVTLVLGDPNFGLCVRKAFAVRILNLAELSLKLYFWMRAHFFLTFTCQWTLLFLLLLFFFFLPSSPDVDDSSASVDDPEDSLLDLLLFVKLSYPTCHSRSQ